MAPEFVMSRKIWQQAAGARGWPVTFHLTGSQESNLEMGQGYKFSKPSPSNAFPPAHSKGSMTSPNWGPIVPIHESMGGHLTFKPQY